MPETISDVKENLQEVGDRIKNSMNNMMIPVRIYQSVRTAERLSGYYVEMMGLERFLDYVLKYYTAKGMGNTEPYQHLSGLLQAVIQTRDQLAGDLERAYVLIDQLNLLQERMTDQAVSAALAKAKKPESVPVVASAVESAAGESSPAALTDVQAIGVQMRELQRQHRELAAALHLPPPSGVANDEPEQEMPASKAVRSDFSVPDDDEWVDEEEEE